MQVNKEHIRKLDYDHYLHPFTDTYGLKSIGARVIVGADGCHISDSDGNKILDGMSGLWCVNLGYNQKSLIEAATNQLNILPFYNSFFNTTNVPAVTLASKLSEVTPEGFERIFYTNSGSEANDTMIRMVRRYWDLKGKHNKKTIISRWNGYHGSTIGGASLSGMTYMHEQGDLPISGIVHIDQPFQLQHGKPGESEEDFGLRAANWLEEKILQLGQDNVAAFIGEPVQGAGGVIIPPKGYWKRIQEICDKYDILLVSDEVICAFGRLGTWFACQHPHINIRPDLIIIAKGLTNGYIPMGGVLVGKRVADVLVSQESGDFNHGFTYSGHPVAAAVGIEVLNQFKQLNLIENLQNKIIPYFAKAFDSLNEHPMVGDAKSIGMVAGLELYQDKTKKQHFPSEFGVGMICREFCFRNNVVMRAVGTRMIIAPPLVLTESLIDELIIKIKKSLDDTYKYIQDNYK